MRFVDISRRLVIAVVINLVIVLIGARAARELLIETISVIESLIHPS